MRSLARQSLRRSASANPVPRTALSATAIQAAADRANPQPATAAGRQSLWPRRSASSARAQGTADAPAPGELRRPSVRHAVRQTRQPSEADPHAGGPSHLRRLSAALMPVPARDSESSPGTVPQPRGTAAAGTARQTAADGASSADGGSSIDGSDSEPLVSIAAGTIVAAVTCTHSALVRCA